MAGAPWASYSSTSWPKKYFPVRGGLGNIRLVKNTFPRIQLPYECRVFPCFIHVNKRKMNIKETLHLKYAYLTFVREKATTAKKIDGLIKTI